MTIDTSTVQKFVEANRASVYMLFHTYFTRNQPFLLRSDLIDGFMEFCATSHGKVLAGSVLGEAIELTQEAAIQVPWIYLAVRPDVGRWTFYRIHAETLQIEWLSVRGTRLQGVVDQRTGIKDGWPIESTSGRSAADFPA